MLVKFGSSDRVSNGAFTSTKNRRIDVNEGRLRSKGISSGFRGTDNFVKARPETHENRFSLDRCQRVEPDVRIA